MKKTFGLLLATLAFSQVASASAQLTVLQCHELSSGPDHGLLVSIDTFIPGASSGFRAATRATVSEETIAGPRKVGVYRVTRSQGPGVGASVYFKGQGFDLEVVVDGTPVQGGHYSRLNYLVEGDIRKAAELSCQFTR